MEENLTAKRLSEYFDVQKYNVFNWTGSFDEYLEKVQENPEITRTAFQRIYDMILSHGTEEYVDSKKKIIKYKIFEDPFENGKNAVFGIDIPLMKLVNFFKSAAQKHGTDKRVLLLKGPVGSSKSTIVTVLKKGLEEYSKTDDGVLYSFSWKIGDKIEPCPMNEEPLKLLPDEISVSNESVRLIFLKRINKKLASTKSLHKIEPEGDLCPFCRATFRNLLKDNEGNWLKAIQENIEVRRVIISEKKKKRKNEKII